MSKQHNINPWGVTIGEARVLDAILQECPKRVAMRLGVSLLTVRCHTQRVRAKMGVRGRTEYLRLWIAFRQEHPGVPA